MRKFLRSSKDGYIYGFNEILASWPEMEVFESDQTVPERIPNLAEFLAPKKEPKKPKKVDAPEGGAE